MKPYEENTTFGAACLACIVVILFLISGFIGSADAKFLTKFFAWAIIIFGTIGVFTYYYGAKLHYLSRQRDEERERIKNGIAKEKREVEKQTRAKQIALIEKFLKSELCQRRLDQLEEAIQSNNLDQVVRLLSDLNSGTQAYSYSFIDCYSRIKPGRESIIGEFGHWEFKGVEYDDRNLSTGFKPQIRYMNFTPTEIKQFSEHSRGFLYRLGWGLNEEQRTQLVIALEGIEKTESGTLDLETAIKLKLPYPGLYIRNKEEDVESIVRGLCAE